MSAELAHEAQAGRDEAASGSALRVRAILALGPVVSLAGIGWACLQPWRLTVLSPGGQGFWWLLAEPPLYVIAVGLAFRLVIAPGLLDDLDAGDE